MQYSRRRLAFAVLLCLWFGIATARSEEAAKKAQAEAAQKLAEAEKAARAARDKEERKKKPAAAPLEVRVVQGNAIAVQGDQLIILRGGRAMRADQVRKHIAGFFKIELAFAKRVCDMSPEQCDQVAAAVVNSIDKVVQIMKQNGRNQNRRARGALFVFQGNVELDFDERQLVLTEVKRLVDENLRPEQSAKYLDEITKQKKQREDYGARLFVARIDEKLRLTPEQREKLLEGLLENWNTQYDDTVDFLVFNQQYVPQVSNNPLMGILDAYQKEMWQSLPKIGPQRQQMIQMGHRQLRVDDFELPDKELDAQPEEAVNEGLLFR